MSPFTSIASRTLGFLPSSTAIAATCWAWTRHRHVPKWKRSGNQMPSGRHLSHGEARGAINDNRYQWNGARHPDGEPVRGRPRVLSQTAPRIRNEAGVRWRRVLLSRRRSNRCRNRTLRSGSGWRALRATAGRPASPLPACAFARGRGPVRRSAKRNERDHHAWSDGGPWALGYYYVLFEDPDGIRLEVNFVPGAGLLAEGAQFNPGTGYV